MADNVTLSSGEVIRTKDIGGVEYQVVQVADATGNIIDSVLLQNGRGLLFVNLGDSAVKGVVVRGQPVSVQPVTIGGRTTTSLISIASPLLDGQAGDLSLTADGRAIVHPYCSPEDQLATTPIQLTTTADVQIYPSLGTGLKAYLVGLMVVNSSATNTAVIIKSGTTEIGRVPAPSNFSSAPAVFPLPMKTTAATALQAALAVAATTVTITPFAYRTRV